MLNRVYTYTRAGDRYKTQVTGAESREQIHIGSGARCSEGGNDHLRKRTIQRHFSLEIEADFSDAPVLVQTAAELKS